MRPADRELTRRNSVLAVFAVCAVLFGGLVLIAREVKLESPASHHAKSLLKLDSALGATLEPLDARAAETLGGGSRADEMVVTSVAADGRASAAGLRVGDVVEEVDGQDPADLDAAIGAVSTDPTQVIVNRHGSHATLRIPAARPTSRS
jgi:membrane-associated protease RseP (regulator of RpoE activity)